MDIGLPFEGDIDYLKYVVSLFIDGENLESVDNWIDDNKGIRFEEEEQLGVDSKPLEIGEYTFVLERNSWGHFGDYGESLGISIYSTAYYKAN